MPKKHQEGKRDLRNGSCRRMEKTQGGDGVKLELWADRQTDRGALDRC
jgi:hypothetical protein